MRLALSIAVLTAAFAMSVGVASAKPVSTDEGLVSGIHKDGLTVYKGIPFAAPPLGKLRWKMPQPPKPWTGVYKADAFKPECEQGGSYADKSAPMSEDCLYLNIWTPAASPGAKLPVMVWIHGGGFTGGSPSEPPFWGNHLAKHGVVVVNLAYRLGVFGFLAHPQLTAESPTRSSGDYALGDLIAGLKWVKQNIAAFGGDPSRVTVFGESAGSMAVGFLMVSPLAKGLFVRAIGESGGAFEPKPVSLKDAEKAGVAFTKSLGVSSVAQLRALPAKELLTAQTKPGMTGVTWPIVDGYVIPEAPLKAEEQGKEIDVPLIIGNNAHEGRLFTYRSPGNKAKFVQQVKKQFGVLSGQVLKAYPAKTNAEAKTSRSELTGDTMFGWTMWTWAKLQSRTSHSKVYFYHFEHAPPKTSKNPLAAMGATHFAEVPYVFGNPLGGGNWSGYDAKLSSEMEDYWTDFAKTGNPNRAGLPNWPAFADHSQKVMHFGAKTYVDGVAYLKRLEILNKKLDAR